MTMTATEIVPATPAQVGYLTELVMVADDGTVSYQAVNWDGSPFQAITGALTEIDVAASEAGLAIDALVAAVDMPQTAPAFGYYEVDGSLYLWDVTAKDSQPRLRTPGAWARARRCP